MKGAVSRSGIRTCASSRSVTQKVMLSAASTWIFMLERTSAVGAWMDECLGRLEFTDQRVLPVAYLVCNFPPPVAGSAGAAVHDEVVTLFHEFGHGLHHLLTRVRYPSLAGINGVLWMQSNCRVSSAEELCLECRCAAVDFRACRLGNGTAGVHDSALAGDAHVSCGPQGSAAAGVRPLRSASAQRIPARVGLATG